MQKATRKRLIIDSKVQGALLRRCIVHWVIFGLAALVLLLPLHILGRGIDGPLSVGLASMWDQYKLLILVVVVIMPAFLYDLVKLSHRFAGPITRLRNEMRRAARGERVKPVHFRENDFWQEVADEFNALIERIEKPVEGRDSNSDENSNSNENSRAEVAESPSSEPEVCDEPNAPVVLNV